jgi:hypothetical protein
MKTLNEINPQTIQRVRGILELDDASDSLACAYRLGAADMAQKITKIAQEMFDHWDSDNDMKVGKMLKALSGNLVGYRQDIDGIVEASLK